MKSILGYLLLGAGIGAVVFKVFEDNVEQWIVFLLIVCGLIFIIESVRQEIREEINKKLGLELGFGLYKKPQETKDNSVGEKNKTQADTETLGR